jgi:hypothetical protein
VKRKTTTTPTRIWSFGALDPTENKDKFHEQLLLSGRYYNSLIEIERKRRERYREMRSMIVPELAKLEEEWKALAELFVAEVKALPKPEKGKRKALPPELLAKKTRRQEIAAGMKELRAKFNGDPSVKERTKVIDEEAYAAIKVARSETELYWGSYLMVEKQCEQAKKSKADPRFRPFRGEGRIGVQIQGGLTLAELTSGVDTRLRLTPRDTPRTKKMQHDLRIRIGSDGRAPIWASFPVCIHRDIPADAVIKWAWIKVSKIANRTRYDLQLTLESETFGHQLPGAGTVAINLGWRAKPDGSRRVAYAVDSFGYEQEFTIPASTERDIAFANSLRSFRDLHFEEAKRALMAWMALHPKLVTPTLTEGAQHIAHWRNPKHLVRLARSLEAELPDRQELALKWRSERLSAQPKKDLFAPATEIFEWLGRSGLQALVFYLELWRRKDSHLWQWEAHSRRKLLLARNERFRVWSRRLADTYAEIRLEEFDLSKMAKKSEPDEEKRPAGFRSSRAAAAPGEFRSRLAEAAGPTKLVQGGKVHHNTVRCFECDHINETSTETMITCGGCGVTWDQDANNCRNQLRQQPDGFRPVYVAAE